MDPFFDVVVLVAVVGVIGLTSAFKFEAQGYN